MSVSTLKRIVKSCKLVWKRIRRSLKSKRNQELFDIVQKEIEELITKYNNGELLLYFFDQSGFSLESPIPYAYQEQGSHIEIPTAKSKRLNVLGMMSLDMDFKSMIYEGSIDSEIVINTIDNFIKYKRITQRMVIVLDNGPMHHSEEFKEKQIEWGLKGVELKFLPPYCPELNKIEILWRFIKYHWLPFSAYENFGKLTDNLCEVLKGVGSKYQINFG